MMSQKDIPLTPEAARKLGDTIVRSRVERGFRSARKLGLESNLDYRTITSLESARRNSVSRSTLAVLEMTMNLPSGYFIDIVEGGSTAAETIELEVPPGASTQAIELARTVAQAAFDAALTQIQTAGARVG